ncbi:ubiquinol oxidase subunit II [Dyella choica]|uniref:Ubiquinol oxidase subunit 2 n=1 Tax=Dyella choica TaxID=1927959 RepID=A0A432M7T7_9GAMM|nr:ubiquinol oxidase subunit II [Dyella choica]RUL77583.1 ubiquinol oxidase subunit II [Dyella choica]
MRHYPPNFARISRYRSYSSLSPLRWATVGVTTLLAGCHLALFAPGGDIGVQERHLIIVSLALMLSVVIPVIALTFLFCWRYRATNKRATYAPTWAHSTTIEWVVWGIPCVIVLFLAVLIWGTTHSLDPYRPLASKTPPVRVQVVALNWKWLFIYPDYRIATVNQLVVPAKTPIDFELTADSIMNSFFIPRLGSQVYAMAGMQTQLHLIADQAGTYRGMSSAFSGPGFSDMHFEVKATSEADFRAWVASARNGSNKLTHDGYLALAKPSVNSSPMFYASVEDGLFEQVVNQYMPGMKGMPGMHNAMTQAKE